MALAAKRAGGPSVRPLSALPETSWREAVADKTAALDARMKGSDERLASVQRAMEVNKDAIDKAVGATEKSVKDAVGGIKADVDKAVSGIKTDMKDALKQELAAMEKVLKSEVSAVKDSLKAELSAVKDSFKSLERLFYIAIAVFIFGKPVVGGIQAVFHEAKEGVSRGEA